MPRQRKRFLKKQPPKTHSEKILALANKLINELHDARYKTELEHIDIGYRSVDIKIHENSRLVVCNVINDWEVRGKWQK